MPSEFDIHNSEHDSTAKAKKVRLVDNNGDPIIPETGLATSAKQDTGNTALFSILAKLTSDPATQTTLAAILAKMISAPSTEAKQDTGNTSLASIKTNTDKIPTSPSTKDDNYPSGTGTDTSVTLTNATTAYSVPSSAPAKNYLLTLHNGSDTDIYIRETTGTTLGFLLPAGGVYVRNMGANCNLFAYCGSAGKVLNVSYRLIN